MILIIDCGTLHLEDIHDCLDTLATTYETVKADDIKKINKKYSGIIISGTPAFLTDLNDEDFNNRIKHFGFIKDSKIPILGICYGHQIVGLVHGAGVSKGPHYYGSFKIDLKDSVLFEGLSNFAMLEEDHYESINLPKGFTHIGKSPSCHIEAMQHETKHLYGVQFHPEISGKAGLQILNNFLNLCK